MALTARNLKYVIPAKDDDRIKRFKQGVEDVTVKRGYSVYGPVKHGVTNDSAVTRLVALPPDDSYDDVQVFATNLDVGRRDWVGQTPGEEADKSLHSTRWHRKRVQEDQGVWCVDDCDGH